MKKIKIQDYVYMLKELRNRIGQKEYSIKMEQEYFEETRSIVWGKDSICSNRDALVDAIKIKIADHYILKGDV